MYAYHNSHIKFYRHPFGAVETESEIQIKILINTEKSIKSVILRLWENDCEKQIIMDYYNTKNGKIYFAKINANANPCLLFYYFIINFSNEQLFYCNDSKMGGEGKLLNYPTHSYQITVFKKGFKTPDFLKNGVIYQIFTDRFYNGNENGEICKKDEDYYYHKNWYETPIYNNLDEYGLSYANDFFGGNLQGIIKKLPYLKELGISIIYLNPIFKAYSNHKYDTGDYEKIDEAFGNDEIFKKLTESAKKLGISIILDGVFSHTGSDSKYFNKKNKYNSVGAYNLKSSPYYAWYSFKNYPDDYDCWWGIKTLPNVNELCNSYLEYIITSKNSIINKWLLLGCFGFRLDVADELPDQFIKMLRETIKEKNSEAALIGEVWEDASNKISYGKTREYFLGYELDSVMNYPLRNALISFVKGEASGYFLDDVITSLFENYPKECFYSLMNVLSTHDVPRIITTLSDAPNKDALKTLQKAQYKLSNEQLGLAIKRLNLALTLQMTFPGAPTVYYGDEAGLYSYDDPFNRGTYPWEKEDIGIMQLYKNKIAIRNKYTALKTGEFLKIYVSENIYSFIRYNENDFFLIALNKNNNDEEFFVNLKKYKIKRLMDIENKSIIYSDNCIFKIKINGISGIILYTNLL